MALTILSAPGTTASVSSEMLFIINEATKANDPVNYPDYKYILDVYFDGNIVARMKANPDPVNKFGIFDVATVLRYYVPSYGLNVSTDKVDYTIADQYSVELGEEFSDTMYTGMVVDSSRYFYRSYAERPYSSSGVVTNGLLSNMPSTITSHGSNVLWNVLPYFSNVSGIADLTVTYYDAAGSVITTSTFDNSDFNANNVRQFNIENTIADHAILSGTFNLRIDYRCSKYPVHYIAWLNPYGTYESQTFGMVSKKNIEIEKKSFSQLPYQINPSGVVSYASNNVFYGGRRDFNKMIKTRLSLTSHLLNADEYTWLADLFKSPDVYLHTAAGWMPVTIVQSNYEYRTYQNSRLTPLQFDVEYSDTFNSQYL